MRILLNICGIATATIALSATAPNAVAQEITATFTCQGLGSGAPEPLGDREGHTIVVGEYSCRADSGPMSGAVGTGTNIWEWDGPNAVERSDSGVLRKPGATVVWQGTEGKLALTMTDGKVTGWTGSGKGVNVIATGSAASSAGKPYAWTAKSTGPGTFTIEGKQ
jgi:hypothetical protein